MSKELEEIKSIVAIHFGALGFLNPSENEQILKDRDKVLNALNELKAIKEANPSEALGLIKRTCEIYVDSLKQRDLIGYDIIEKQINEALDAIKQALIKSQEQEKVLEIIKPLCEVVETPVRKDRYLKMNGVVVYTFKNEEEFELLKRYFK